MNNLFLGVRTRLGRRTASFLVVATVIGIPAGALRAMCAGNSCDATTQSSPQTPFCSLPDELRRLIALGYYEGRSPDLMAVTGETMVAGGDAFRSEIRKPLWPSTKELARGTVPIVFFGAGVRADSEIPTGTSLDSVAETLANLVDLRRAHPEVRSGKTLVDVASGEVPKLLLEVVWKGVGADELEQRPNAWPVLKRLMNRGVGTLEGKVGSLPLDPAASITTIGTGGLPYQHGIVGSVMRRDKTTLPPYGEGIDGNRVVFAWSKNAPTSVIATLGDDLDRQFGQQATVGLVGNNRVDRGLVGDGWYSGADHDELVIMDKATRPLEGAQRAEGLLRSKRFGRDNVPDLLGVVQSGSLSGLDRSLGRLLRAARSVSGGSFTVAVTATGRSAAARARAMPAKRLTDKLERHVVGTSPVIQATVPGGIYLDQRQLARLELTDDLVLQELLRLRGREGETVMADAFPSIAITFGKYC
jgi:hypothetical protein